MGCADEHDTRRRARVRQTSAPEQVARLVGELHLLQRLAAGRVPDPIAAADDLHLDEQAPLAVPDQHHPAQRLILGLGVEPRHRPGQRLAQAKRGERDGVAGVVLEEPELVAAADLRVGQEAIVHLHPADHARRRAVHEDDRDEPRPIRRRGDERRPLPDDPRAGREVRASRARMIGTPVNESASAAVGSLSSGTCSPATVSDGASHARWSSSGP